MTNQFDIGDAVQWQWLSYLIEGVVEERFEVSTVRTIKGKRIKRNGSATNPAYLVRSDSGNIALKLGSELAKRAKIFQAT